MLRTSNSVAIALVAFVLALAGGCASSYSVPGRSADFRAMGITAEEVEELTDTSIAQRLNRKPLASFPASVAIVRVQGSNYSSYTARGYGHGNYSIVTTRDVETTEDFERIARLPMIARVEPLNRLVIPAQLRNEQDLRSAAANVQADMLLVYTFDTTFESDKSAAPLGLVTLGLFPDRTARVTSTAVAALLDTRNGYVYGLAEGTAKQTQLTNAWNNREAVDKARRKAEQEAFAGLINEVQRMWQRVASTYGPQQTLNAQAQP